MGHLGSIEYELALALEFIYLDDDYGSLPNLPNLDRQGVRSNASHVSLFIHYEELDALQLDISLIELPLSGGRSKMNGFLIDTLRGRNGYDLTFYVQKRRETQLLNAIEAHLRSLGVRNYKLESNEVNNV